MTVPLEKLILLFSVLFITGTLLTLPLYRFDFSRLIHSRLSIKIVFWIPIFALFIGTLYAPPVGQLTVLFLLILVAGVEMLRASGQKRKYALPAVYYAIFSAGLCHFVLLYHRSPSTFITILILLCFATVLADVGAFFFGNYLGRHKLPSALNDNKSWEGVLGEVFGALLGVLLVNTFVTPVSTIWLFLPLGIGSALGDLINSYVKRKLGIEEWSRIIPGHGGVMDRFSSMAGSAAATYCFLLVFS